MNPKLSITIVNYNQKYFPRMCTEALKKSKTDFEFEIIFCDNNSHDESLEYLRKAEKNGEIKLTEPGKNLGYGSGNNFAAKEAGGKYILVLNADTLYNLNYTHWLPQHLFQEDISYSIFL